ncbi:MAG: PilZ domain-containing protein [Magnetococcales bacterium]|nr:PilZ domain-containing protein [Magnetococcales bacterium]
MDTKLPKNTSLQLLAQHLQAIAQGLRRFPSLYPIFAENHPPGSHLDTILKKLEYHTDKLQNHLDNLSRNDAPEALDERRIESLENDALRLVERFQEFLIRFQNRTFNPRDRRITDLDESGNNPWIQKERRNQQDRRGRRVWDRSLFKLRVALVMEDGRRFNGTSVDISVVALRIGFKTRPIGLELNADVELKLLDHQHHPTISGHVIRLREDGTTVVRISENKSLFSSLVTESILLNAAVIE